MPMPSLRGRTPLAAPLAAVAVLAISAASASAVPHVDAYPAKADSRGTVIITATGLAAGTYAQFARSAVGGCGVSKTASLQVPADGSVTAEIKPGSLFADFRCLGDATVNLNIAQSTADTPAAIGAQTSLRFSKGTGVVITPFASIPETSSTYTDLIAPVAGRFPATIDTKFEVLGLKPGKEYLLMRRQTAGKKPTLKGGLPSCVTARTDAAGSKADATGRLLLPVYASIKSQRWCPKSTYSVTVGIRKGLTDFTAVKKTTVKIA